MIQSPHIRPLTVDDWPDWLRMTLALHPDTAQHEHEPWMRTLLTRSDVALFVAERANGTVCGFVEAGSRPYADGCESSPVGYIEGWFVDADMRRAGVGRALLAAAEQWARGQGFTEMASDALLDNTLSHQAHEGSGYAEVERLVLFRKAL